VGGESRAQIVLPRLYAILDAEALEQRGLDLVATAIELRDAGATLMQYRHKLAGGKASTAEVLGEARRLAASLDGSGCRLILNDYAELVVASGFGGLHVGQGDLDAHEAREMIGGDRVLGISAHDEAQMAAAACGPADYVAIGPVFRTNSKLNAEAVVGLEGVRQARGLTKKPLVAIGGISHATIPSVLDAGADAVAVIGALYRPGRSVGENARALLAAADLRTPTARL